MINVNLKLSVEKTIQDLMTNHFKKQNGGSDVFSESQQEVLNSIESNVEEYFDSAECMHTSFSGELMKKLFLLVGVQGTVQHKSTGEVREIDNDAMDATIRSYQIENTVLNHIKLIVLMRLLSEGDHDTVSRLKISLSHDLNATLERLTTSVDEDIANLLTEDGNTHNALMAEYSVVFGEDFFDFMVQSYGGNPITALSVLNKGNQNIASQELILYSILMFKMAGEENKPMAHLAVSTAAEQLVSSTLATVLRKYYSDVLGEEFIQFLVTPVKRNEVH